MLTGNPGTAANHRQICGQTLRSILMSEITRVYKFGAITGAAIIAAAAVVAAVGTAIGA